MLAKQRRIDRVAALLRVLFSVIWMVDASLKWLPDFRAHYVDLIGDEAKGQPAWLIPWFHFWQWLFSLQPTVFAYVLALVESYIALALFLGFARKVTYILGIIWTILIWSTAEGFGKPDMGPWTDVGTAIIYTVVFLALLAFDARFGTGTYTVDVVLERWIPWWRRIAEVRQ